jgi:hypothetical protein
MRLVVRPFKDVMRRLLAMRPIPYVVRLVGTEREENLIYILIRCPERQSFAAMGSGSELTVVRL